MAPHHGSRTSSTPLFLEAVMPETIVVSSGYHYQYGALHPEIGERYECLNVRILTTPDHGAVTFITDGETIWVGTAAK
jgi:competence protein ComEC